MKIGIFGDSFADTLVCDKEEVSKHNIIGWPDLLKTEYNIVNFSRGGTSLFYSYMLFKEKQTDFDKIIFVRKCVNMVLHIKYKRSFLFRIMALSASKSG